METESKDGWLVSADIKAKATEKELKFIFEQAEKQLKESLESGNTVQTRTTILLTIIVGAITSLLSAIIGKVEANNYNLSPALISLAFVLLYLIREVFELKQTLWGEVFRTTGSQPNTLLHQWFFVNYTNDDKRFKALYVSEIESYQRRILKNNNLNAERWDRFRSSLKRLLILPVLVICIYSVFNLVFFLFPLL